MEKIVINVRNIDLDLWRKANSKRVLKGYTQGAMINESLQAYLEKKF